MPQKPGRSYRVQRRECLGKMRRGWGYGTYMAYGPWVTVFRDMSLDAAMAYHTQHSAAGLYQWRIFHAGKTVKGCIVQ